MCNDYVHIGRDYTFRLWHIVQWGGPQSNG